MTREQEKEERYGIATQILELRWKKGWSQQYLSERSGIPRSNISRFESGNHNMSIDTLNTLVKALGAKIEISER